MSGIGSVVKVVGLVSVMAAIMVGAFSAYATPPANISFVPVARATLQEFNVNRNDKLLDWEIELEAPQAIDVATQIVRFEPGGSSGWHTHPGPVFFVVRTGTLTVYEGDDPICRPLVFPAGTGAVEAGTSSHMHMIRNETNAVAEAVVTYMVPVGTPQAQLRADRPNPGNCSF
jgi:mannose-6-phosphate isomerase-like protein (cupin superfamily)